MKRETDQPNKTGCMGKLITYLLLAANAFLAGMLILTAYSPYLQPQVHPVPACLGLTFPLFLAANLCFALLWLFARPKYVLLPLAGLALCFQQIRTYVPLNLRQEPVPEQSIKLLSYNVMGFDGQKKENGENPILAYIARSGADIVCLQECLFSPNRDRLTKQDALDALGNAYPYHSLLPSGKGTSQLACFSKYPILSAKPVPYESASNGSMIYTLKIGNDTVAVVNNHLESNKLTKEDRGMYEEMIDAPNAQKVKTSLKQLVRKFAEATALRAVQADSVACAIARCPHPYIVACGDFNDVTISYVHRTLTRQLKDAFTESGKGLGISYHLNKFYFRIDNILVSKNLKSYRCTVDNRIADSDHYPIWCYLSR